MAVTITKKLWNSGGSAYKDISKIVFTSPNISSPAAAGTRSHILPGSAYIGTWYEAVDFMYRFQWNQNAPTIQGTYFSQLYLYNPTFTFGTDTTFSGISLYIVPTETNQIIYHDKDNRGIITAATASGTVSIEGTTYNRYNITISGSVGTATISGSTTTVSGSDSLYTWKYSSSDNNSSVFAHASNSVIYEVTNGEAYSCRLTAWDDDTHSTTSNKILDEEHYRATCLAYRSKGGTKQVPKAGTSSSVYGTNLFIHPPGFDLVLKGNDSYYGDFDLTYVANGGVTGSEIGDYLLFLPRLADMDDSFTAGNYDFVTTLHYQYT